MRLSKSLTAGAALVALVALTGCGGGSGGGDGDGRPADAASGGKPAGKSLPKAKDVASMERFVSQYTTCGDLETDATLGQYSETAEKFEGLPKGADAGVKERAYCKGQRGPIAMLAVSDMKRFLLAIKANEAAGKKTILLVGADFAVVPTGSDDTRAMKPSGLLVASCNAAFNSKLPSGYSKTESAVEGCVTTDYIPA
ncbi:hypothetical protein [Streptomyces sp. NPDC054838]